MPGCGPAPALWRAVGLTVAGPVAGCGWLVGCGALPVCGHHARSHGRASGEWPASGRRPLWLSGCQQAAGSQPKQKALLLLTFAQPLPS